MNNIIKNENGFTLIEIILAIILISIIAGLFYTAYFDSTRTWTFNKNKVELQRAQDIINIWFAKYIRIADLDSINIDETSNINGDELKFNAVDFEGDILQIRYYVDNNKKLKLDYGSDTKLICNCDVDGLDFNKDTDSTIRVTMTIINDDQQKPYKFSSAFYPRLQ